MTFQNKFIILQAFLVHYEPYREYFPNTPSDRLIFRQGIGSVSYLNRNGKIVISCISFAGSRMLSSNKSASVAWQ